jgi:hypothetical protein
MHLMDFIRFRRARLAAFVTTLSALAPVLGAGPDPSPPRAAADWLRDRVPTALQGRVFILENWQWLALVVLVFVGVVVDRLVRLGLGSWVRRLLASSAHLREKGTAASFEKPVGILAMALFWLLALPLLDLPLSALSALRVAAQLVLSAALVWGVYRLVDLLSAHFAALAARTESRFDDLLIPLVSRAIKIVVLTSTSISRVFWRAWASAASPSPSPPRTRWRISSVRSPCSSTGPSTSATGS